jgi:hypothetical protein
VETEIPNQLLDSKFWTLLRSQLGREALFLANPTMGHKKPSWANTRDRFVV